MSYSGLPSCSLTVIHTRVSSSDLSLLIVKLKTAERILGLKSDTTGWKLLDGQIALELPRQYRGTLCYGGPEHTEEQFTDMAAESKFKEGFSKGKGFPQCCWEVLPQSTKADGYGTENMGVLLR